MHLVYNKSLPVIWALNMAVILIISPGPVRFAEALRSIEEEIHLVEPAAMTEAEFGEDGIGAGRVPPGNPPLAADLMDEVLPSCRLYPVGVVGLNAIKDTDMEIAAPKDARR